MATYRAEATFAWPRKGPGKPPFVVVKGNLYELKASDIPKNLKKSFTKVEVDTPPPAKPTSVTAKKKGKSAKVAPAPTAVAVTVTEDDE